jgi:polyhydroxyalkanoate synthesis regulator phasin
MTKSDTAALSDKQKMALPIFASTPTVDEACKQLELSRNTFYEWLKKPEFKQELNRLRNELVEDAVSQLKLNASKAAKTLVDLTCREDHPGVQRAAANDILNHLLKYKEMHEMEERVTALEEHLKKNKC